MLCNKIKVITTHAGEKCFNGGEYGFHQLFTRTAEGWELTFHTTADFEFCLINNFFQSCDGCPAGPRENCQERPKYLANEEMAEALGYDSVETFHNVLATVMEPVWIMDETGHKPIASEYKNACVICYP